MVEKYHPNHLAPITDYEREILTILQEEAAEVIMGISKILRFGKEDVNPSTGKTNTLELGLEVGDLMHMIDLVRGQGIIKFEDLVAGEKRKRCKLQIYLQSTPP